MSRSEKHACTRNACPSVHRYLVDNGEGASIQVLDECIEGSVISNSVNSVTKMANPTIIKSATGDTWLIIDTPGYGDTDGPIDTIVNAVSIATVVKVCSSLRVLMLFNQSDFVANRFSNCVELSTIVSNLFCDFATASKSLAIWVNKRWSDAEVGESKLKKMLKKAAEEKKLADPEEQAKLRWMLELLVKQAKQDGAFTVLSYKEEEEDDDSDDGSSSDGLSDVEATPPAKASTDLGSSSPKSAVPPKPKRQKSNDGDADMDSDNATESTKITFEVHSLLCQLQKIEPLANPGSQIRLSLPRDATEHLRTLAREVRDRCEEAVERPDFPLIASSMQLLADLVERLKEAEPGAESTTGASELTTISSEVKEVTKVVQEEYLRAAHAIKTRVAEQVERTTGLLQGALSESRIHSPIEGEALHAFAWARRCVGASAHAASHVKELPREEDLAPSVVRLLSELCRITVSLEINDPIIKVSLVKLMQVGDYFARCAMLPDGATDAVFGEISRAAYDLHRIVQEAVVEKATELLEGASAHVDKGCQAVRKTLLAALAAGGDGMVNLSASEDETDGEAIGIIDHGGECLRTLREAELRLSELVPKLEGVYEHAQDAVEARLGLCLDRVLGTASGATHATTTQLIELTIDLVSLDKAAHSFGLREHFEADGLPSPSDIHVEVLVPAADTRVVLSPPRANRLDALSEQGINCVIEWHTKVTDPIADDAKEHDEFAYRICDHRAALETAKQLFSLGSSPKTGHDKRLRECIHGATADRQKDLEHRVHAKLELFTKLAVDDVKDLEGSRSGAYAEYRTKLTMLEQTAWWDAIATSEEATISRALDACVSPPRPLGCCLALPPCPWSPLLLLTQMSPNRHPPWQNVACVPRPNRAPRVGRQEHRG